MPIPDLNGYGVLPAGRHVCSLQEIADRYANNEHRQQLWEDFENFLAWLGPQPSPQIILIDGGFTSDKPDPKDIDVVLDVSNCPPLAQQHWTMSFFTDRSDIERDYRVDFWVYVPGFPKDLRAFFEYVRPEEAAIRGMSSGDRKGLLEVHL